MVALPSVILSTGLYPGEVPPHHGNSYEVSTKAKAGNSEVGAHNLIHNKLG